MSDFGGRTITGDINHYGYDPVEQHDPQVFLDALDALLAVPGVEAVRWNQYTPYFNDGEACVFRIYSAYVKLTGDDEEAGDYEDGFRSRYDMYEYDKRGSSVYADWVEVPITVEGVDTGAVKEALTTFERILENGHHYVVLAKKFGDPAQVTATREGFEVEFYDHD